jgi:hypothetical protein
MNQAMKEQTAGTERKYVFVCGLQRSGTSVLGRNVARLEKCTGFKNTGVLMDEGQFLQDIYPIDAEFGGAGRFGFDPRAHRTESSELLTPENVARLRACWHAHWDENETIFVEKTPANLLMTRFLQAVFPNSYFIVMQRHPVPVSMASQRWKVSVSPLYRLFEHWLHCHELFEEDRKYLKHVYELRYEDYVKTPGKYHEEIATFLGTRVPEPPKEDTLRTVAQWPNPLGLRVPEHAMEELTEAHNKKYLDRWCNLLEKSFFGSYYRYITRKYEPKFAKYGYSLIKGLGVSEEAFQGGKVSDAIGALCCLGADTGAFLLRLSVHANVRLRGAAKAVLPAFVVRWVRQARERRISNKVKYQVSDVRSGMSQIRSQR